MRSPKTALALLTLLAALAAPASAQALSRDFFGIAPQTSMTDADAQYMRAGGIGSVRLAVSWGGVQPTPNGGYDWGGIDDAVEVAARQGLSVLPFLYATPQWVAPKPTSLPTGSRARGAWVAFVRAAVERYGPRGEFWREHWPGSADPVPKTPIRTWQVWNEANFFYFAFPVSPTRYAKLLKSTYGAIKRADPGAKVILSGLFGDPDERGARGMAAADFLDALYRVPGIQTKFDGVALHPYAVDAAVLEELTEGMRTVMRENRDPGAALYITEMGWGSQNDPNVVAFEQGIRGQVRQLRDSYRYLIANRHRLNLRGTYWFSWKDLPGSCSFCDSVGFFRKGPLFKAKPSWHAFVAITGGRARP
jgi:polysaccharide biosynthesis protein PslG